MKITAYEMVTETVTHSQCTLYDLPINQWIEKEANGEPTLLR
ncbi:hypothetical protein J2Z48_002047 [Croceifilum oryzae]|uniref:Uncharacterized protein n=1 Tax=Croceifilum oryzae TaxID=1553429 RepID=A0AAJ1WSY0_9BACL|nr:hypothetical protein [Croceifilum oryzae]MDQ0417863.1 hypothetical protein [Croceifilum oryzae]